ncbi:hypothetical protein [Gracilibacillus salinarum]|nr:hypothetical protein [Gracilibacillus salinarum]
MGNFHLLSMVNAVLLLGMATVIFHHTSFITSFLALNTIASFVSP